MTNGKRGFANMSPERRAEIARMGGKAVRPENRSYSRNRELARASGQAGGKNSMGNFAKDPERAAEAGRKGGSASPGNFARDRERAVEAGRKGGSTPKRRTPHAAV